MKGLALVGIALVILELLSFVVPVPHSENHGIKVGDAKIGVQTESHEKLPYGVGIALVAGGVIALVAGNRRS